jgi:hypothetical protein
LSELDGFDPTTGIALLAATNRPEILDAALLRAGRFDRQVLVDPPDRLGRAQILAVQIKMVVPDLELKVEDVTALTPGFTGADLANLVNEAALVATRRQGDRVTIDDFTTPPIERIVAGLAAWSPDTACCERQGRSPAERILGRSSPNVASPLQRADGARDRRCHSRTGRGGARYRRGEFWKPTVPC